MSTPRLKKLAVFFDGTWNSADQCTQDGQPCPTNVAKLFAATVPQDSQQNPQIVHYVQGIGTRRFERLSGGGFGYGISDNIKEGYRFLVSNYEPGDAIYLFGFSRGAYTARSLAGMIRNVGIVTRDKLYLVNDAYRRYKDKAPAWHPKGHEAHTFRQQHTWGDEKVRFLGVFDTVGALGAPFGITLGWLVDKLFHCSFHDTQLSSIIESAYHALAIDERRLPFQPTFMDPNTQHNAANFEQKWFPGVHANVGGGYVSTGLSDLALEWMADKATQHGLHLDLAKIANPSFQPDVMAHPSNSQTLLYRAATVLLIKLPGYLGLVPKKYHSALPHLQWNGDYIRPIPHTGDMRPFLGPSPGQHPGQYQGSVHVCTIKKINQCWDEYQPPNIWQAAG